MLVTPVCGGMVLPALRIEKKTAGARPLKRAVQRYLQDPLADKILAGEVHDGSVVKVDEGDGGLVIVPS
jgi:ATP-dependent Clp protease ATP-binding subunit ClpA